MTRTERIGGSSVDREVLGCGLLHHLNLLLLVQGKFINPALDLLVAPLDAVNLVFDRIGGSHIDIGFIFAIFGIILRQPGQVHTFLARVDIVLCLFLRADWGKILLAHILPLGNHHGLNLVGSVFEGCCNLLPDGHRILEFD